MGLGTKRANQGRGLLEADVFGGVSGKNVGGINCKVKTPSK